jgi:hypothetical protein
MKTKCVVCGERIPKPNVPETDARFICNRKKCYEKIEDELSTV